MQVSKPPISGLLIIRWFRYVPRFAQNYSTIGEYLKLQLPVAHGNALHQSNAKHKRCETAAAVTDERKRQPGYRHNVQINTHVDHALEEDQRRDAIGDAHPGHITRLLRGAQASPDDQCNDHDDKQRARQAEFFRNDREDKVRVAHFQKAQLGLCSVTISLSKKSTRTDGNTSLFNIVRCTERRVRIW